jgi:hypothetical protein
MTGLVPKYQITYYHMIIIPVKYNLEVIEAEEDSLGTPGE